MLFKSPKEIVQEIINEECQFLSRYDRQLLAPILERMIRNDRWQCYLVIQRLLDRHRFVEGKAAEMVRASIESVRAEIAKAYSESNGDK